MGREKKGIDKAKVIEMYRDGMSVNDIATAFECSEASVYWHLRDVQKRSRGGAVAKTIPACEIHKRAQEAEKKAIAERNAENACVMLEKCSVNLVGNVGKYNVNPTEGSVHVSVEGKDCEMHIPIYSYGIDISIKDIPELIEELKGVCRCAKSFELGNAMW